mgnify:CR=1 FL=1
MLKYIFKDIIDSNMKTFKRDLECVKGLFPFAVILGFLYLINYLLGN